MKRIETVERVVPSVVCMFDVAKHGGGSGVLISPDGYGLTNYHVVAGMLGARKGWGGLGDGVLYEMEILGIDPTGDVAMIHLKGPGQLPYSNLGDSSKLKLGDTVMPMGNPFVMSENYSPTVTMGIVTGLNRYQQGVRGNLTYSDCIQTDASINPGNSGGPLFNLDGEIVGINGRISVNTRGRYNVGFGYAISSNQIRRFIPALRAGRLARHGTLLATVEEDGNRIFFNRIATDSPLGAADVRIGDRLIAFDGIALQSANHYVSVLGAYPEDWPVPLEIERDGNRRIPIVRLAPIEPNLKSEFIADREANLRQVRRVLDAYRTALAGGNASAEPTEAKRMSWSITREHLNDGGSPPQLFAAHQDADGRVQIVRTHDDGRTGTIFAVDQESVTQREATDAEPGAAPLAFEMYYAALYWLHLKIPLPAENLDLSHVEVLGADSAAGREDIKTHQASEPWEVLSWPLGNHKTARFSFDQTTGRCMRARITDVPTGARMTIEFMDHQDVGGVSVPCTIEVTSSNQRFRDKLSDWKPAP